MIVDAINDQIEKLPQRDTPYRRLLDIMEERTVDSGNHIFITTNWDYLLERDVDAWVEAHHPGRAPRFLRNSQVVYHFNGTTERELKHGSSFLLETDIAGTRKATFEASEAFARLLWSQLIVVVGMSFECQSDRGLLGALREHEDKTPIGSALFILVEPCGEALEATCEKLAASFPRAYGLRVHSGFAEWLNSGMKELAGRIFR